MWTTRKRIDSLVKTYRRPAVFAARESKERKTKAKKKRRSNGNIREKKTVRYREKGESFRSSRSRRRSLKGLKPVHAGSVVRLFTSEVGRVLIPFSFSSMFHGRLRSCLPSSAATPSSPRPTASRGPPFAVLFAVLCSPERPRPAISVMHPQTHPCSPSPSHTSAPAHNHGSLYHVDACGWTSIHTEKHGAYRHGPRQTARVHTPGPKAPITRESPGVMRTQWQSLREQRNRS